MFVLLHRNINLLPVSSEIGDFLWCNYIDFMIILEKETPATSKTCLLFFPREEVLLSSVPSAVQIIISKPLGERSGLQCPNSVYVKRLGKVMQDCGSSASWFRSKGIIVLILFSSQRMNR